MEKKKTNKFGAFIKRNLYYAILCVVLVGAIIAVAVFNTNSATKDLPETGEQVVIPNENEQAVASEKKIKFQLPVKEAKIIRDYSANDMLMWESLGVYKVHQAVDFAGDANTKVLAIAEGKVLGVETTNESGTIVKIAHANGYVSIYKSIAANVSVKVGDQVKAGAEIGLMSASMGDEANLGIHLHLEMEQNGKIIDPNLYLNLSNK